MAPCSNCGKDVSNSAVHCPYCGKNLQNQSLQLGLMALLCGISPGLIITSLINLILKFPILINWILAILISYYVYTKCKDIIVYLYVGIICCVIFLFVLSPVIDDSFNINIINFFIPEAPKLY